MNELCSLPGEADINRLSLKLLQDYYQHNLTPYSYEFELPGNATVNVSFPPAQFCHLLAIEKIMTLEYTNTRRSKHYKGLRGYNNIEQLNLTLNNLNQTPQRPHFRRNENKFLYFHLMHKVIEKPILIDYDPAKVTPTSRIDADFLFHDVLSDTYLHLGVVKKNNSINDYVPRSWFIQPKGDIHIDKFINGQTQIAFKTLHKKEITLPN
ncbi:hypothetical protein BK709_19580 [Bacillus thuringiensis serovar shandongiensis]|nr:hypothetical protein BK717_04945 [Bacillus thuringiensis serovar malayensis]OUB04515.1 hypothetical protein BK709_19580 [Bacillus thuringiensis serovar shandongiensis]